MRDIYEMSVTQRRIWDEQRVKKEEAVVKEGHGDDVKVGKWFKLERKGGKEAGEILLEFNTNLIMGGNRIGGAKQMDYPQGRPGIEPFCIFELKEKYAWEKLVGEDSVEYYYNEFSGETSWEKPSNFFDLEGEREAKEKMRQDLIEHGEMGKLLALEGGKLEDGESEERSDEFF